MYIWQRVGWPEFTWDIKKIAEPLARVRRCQGRLLGSLGALGFELGRDAQAEVLVEETIKTAAVEGATLHPDAVRSSVTRRLGLPTAGLPLPDRSVDGLVEVLLDATMHHQEALTAKRLMGWQAALFPTGFSGMHRIRVGQWREKEPMRVVSGPIGRERVHFEAPPAMRLNREIQRFLAWWSKSQKTIDGLLRAGIAHLYFVTIHPFEDGNGRIARAITDMALAQDECIEQRFYSLSSAIMAERNVYYDMLEKTQKGELKITEWLLWFLMCTERAIEDSDRLLAHITNKVAFWRTHAQVDLSDRQRKVINRLLNAGPNGFEGGLTTRKYVSLTKASRATAFREIADLVKKGLIQAREGKGRSASYEISEPFQVKRLKSKAT